MGGNFTMSWIGTGWVYKKRELGRFGVCSQWVLSSPAVAVGLGAGAKVAAIVGSGEDVLVSRLFPQAAAILNLPQLAACIEGEEHCC